MEVLYSSKNSQKQAVGVIWSTDLLTIYLKWLEVVAYLLSLCHVCVFYVTSEILVAVCFI